MTRHDVGLKWGGLKDGRDKGTEYCLWEKGREGRGEGREGWRKGGSRNRLVSAVESWRGGSEGF